MRLTFVLLVFLPALIHGRPMDEDEPSNSHEELGSKDCVDGTEEGSNGWDCQDGSKCNYCQCKSKDTGKQGASGYGNQKENNQGDTSSSTLFNKALPNTAPSRLALGPF